MRSILIVDDNPAEQFLYKQLFQTTFKDINVIKAMNGKEALSILENCSKLPQAIILDLNMPIMDGEQFIKEYQKKFSRDQIHIYLMADQIAAVKYKNAMIHDYIKMRITKPLDKKTLDIISNNLQLKRATHD